MLAASRKKPLGQVLTDLIRSGLSNHSASVVDPQEIQIRVVRNGVPLLPKRGDVITNDHVRRLMDEI